MGMYSDVFVKVVNSAGKNLKKKSVLMLFSHSNSAGA